MARRLTPDPLQVDPWTNPVRISLPLGIKYFLVKEEVGRIERNVSPIEMGTNCDGTTGFGVFEFVSHRADTRLDTVSGPSITSVRKSDLGVGDSPEDEADEWSDVNKGDFQAFTQQDWSSFEVDTYTVQNCFRSNGLGILPGAGLVLNGGNTISYFEEYNSTFFRYEQFPIKDLGATIDIAYLLPKENGAITRGGDELCCILNEPSPKLFFSSDTTEEMTSVKFPFNYSSGREKITADVDGKERPATLVGVATGGVSPGGVGLVIDTDGNIARFQIQWLYVLDEKINNN